jgi:predicted amidohydrolase YtcJ
MRFGAMLLVLLSLFWGAAAAQQVAWVERSNDHAQVMLGVRGAFQPEVTSYFGVSAHDENVFDLGPRLGERYRAALTEAKSELQRRLAEESDPNVRQDLQIMIDAASQEIEGSELNEKHLLPWFPLMQVVFFGQNALLQPQADPVRRPAALVRLRRYTGLAEGSEPIFVLARARFEAQMDDASLLGPVRLEVEQELANMPALVAGLRQLYAQAELDGAEEALEALERQVSDHADWLREVVMPRSRDDFRLPAELYAFQLRQFGVDIEPQLLMRRAQLGFMETRAAMEALAPVVAKHKGLEVTGYRELIRALKQEQLGADEIEPFYRDTVMPELERQIASNRVVDLPGRPMIMRLATEAETAAQPAPHMQPPPLVNNTGQLGQFVLPLGNPRSADDTDAAYDDFNYPAAAWTLTAHEGRPGHELQFTAMVERGVSLARSLFALNSANVEGWALYAEAEMIPYEPLEGQLIALQFRLIRAARAMLDPMLNLGLISREEAERVLREEVVLSAPMTRQELDRYTFRAPGQATSYFYGYSRILELRAETELALGEHFDRLAFNNFLLDQGLLPLDLLAATVRAEFVPAQKTKARPDPATLPGLTDSHYHLRKVGERELALNLAGSHSLEELQARLREFADAHPEHAWITGRGWIETHWSLPEFPTRYDLDRVVSDRPVYLVRADGHAGIANSKALELANIGRDTEPPFGGDILKDASGEPTGMLIDRAQGLVQQHIPGEGLPSRKEALRVGGEVAARQGWTTIHNIADDWEDVEALRELYAEDRMPVRNYVAVLWPGSGAERLLRDGPILGEFDGRLTVRAIKINLDGALGSRGAALLEPYTDDPGNTGLLTHTVEELAPVLERALRAGIQVWTHAIGDRANRLALDLYEQAFAAVPAAERRVADPRWRIEHAQHLSEQDIPRFAQLGVIASMQPSHAIGDLHFAPRRLGLARLRHAYAWRSLLDAGAIVIGGSDAPIEVGDPRIEFHAATTRTDLAGFSGEGWHPEQAVSWEEAVKMFTEWADYASFADESPPG